jgi:hypothetical protein
MTEYFWLFLIFFAFIVLLALAYLRAMLGGELLFTSVDREVTVLILPRRPWAVYPTGNLFGATGRIRVRGSLSGRSMHIHVRLDHGTRSSIKLKLNGKWMIAGVLVEHRDRPKARKAELPATEDTEAEFGI